MTWTVLTSLDSGAPALTAVNGALANVFRWALPQLGFAIEYGAAGNATVFRAATGNRQRFCLNNNAGSAGSSLVRGALGATSATAWTNVFPTTGQVSNADSRWPAGYAYNSSFALPYIIAGNGVFFYFITLGGVYSDSPSYCQVNFFGDVPTDYGTGWETVISMSGTVNNGLEQVSSVPYPFAAGVYWARRIDGGTLSTVGNISIPYNYFGATAGTPAARAGYLNRLMREKVFLNCTGVASGSPGTFSVMQRGWLPNLWAPIHNGNAAMVTGDTFTDSVYNNSATFLWLSSMSSYGFILETSDTWSKS